MCAFNAGSKLKSVHLLTLLKFVSLSTLLAQNDKKLLFQVLLK